MKKLSDKARMYARSYGQPPYGREIEGTAELLLRMADSLDEYEDLAAQGKLLKLPCAVWDTVYTLNTLPSGKAVIGETIADAFLCALGILEERFGKTIFLTYEEAEAALKELQKG